jgi:hypothetical protein
MSKYLHRLLADNPETREHIITLLAELQRTFIRARTPIGPAISPVVSAWRLERDGSYVVQFSPLAAERLPEASGLPLLESARKLSAAPDSGLEPAA